MNAIRNSFNMLFGKRPLSIQVGAVCVDPASHKVLLITSRGTGRWVIPKGWPMNGRTLPSAAATEAWEEAGVRGTISGEELGRYTYDKIQDAGFPVKIDVRVFLLEVDKLATKFPEKDERNRKWFTPSEAATNVNEGGLKKIFQGLARRHP